MIKLLVRKGVHVFSPPIDVRRKVEKDLTFDNPLYVNAKRFGKYASSTLEPKLKFFSYDANKDVLYIPRGYMFYILKYIKEQGYEFEIQDSTTLLPQINVEFKGELREYQEEALRDIRKYPVGVLESGTGSGKTVMGIAMIAARKQPTLIIVHTKELLNQWNERIQQFLGVKPGLIGGGKCDIQPITVGIVQSVQNRIGDLKDKFGHIICDEVHRCPASTWTDVLSQFSARYYLGLSATAFRSDGLSHAIYAFIGPKIHTVSRETLHDIGAVLKPEIYRIPTRFNFHYTGDYSSMVSALVDDSARNRLIAETIASDIKQHGSSVLIASDRVQHCLDMQTVLESLQIKSEVLVSGCSKKEREQIVKDVDSGKCKVLLSTISLIGEGFDASNLHALFITTPIKFSGRLLQIVGRVLRPEKGKTARVYDFRDDNVKPLRESGKKRDTVYRHQWGV